MTFTLLTAALEQLLNQLIKLDDNVSAELSCIIRKQLSIAVTDLNVTVTLLFDGSQFMVLPQGDNNSDCFIAGDLNTLMALKQPENVTQLIRSGQLTLEGDLAIAQQFSKAFDGLDIDWADNLSAYLGDGPAFTLVNFMQQTAQRAKQQAKLSQANFTSLLQDELRVAIHPLEAQLFKQQCRALQQEIAQIEQRIMQLSKAL